VEIILNHTQQDGRIVHALLAGSTAGDPLRGIVVAGTGNGTVSERLLAALTIAQEQGVHVQMGSRCVWDDLPSAADSELRQPAKARVALMLKLLSSV
jgi:L-asparaginase